MSRPYFRSGQGKTPRPGAVNHAAGLDPTRRIAALEQGAAHRLAPSSYAAAIYVANSGSPTNTNTAAFQKIGSGGGTATYTTDWDYYPTGGTAQADTGNKRLNVQRAGLYLVTAATAFDALVDTSYVGVGVYIDGAQGPVVQTRMGGANIARVRLAEYILLAAGSYLELYAFQNDSATEPYTTTSKWLNRISMALVGPPA